MGERFLHIAAGAFKWDQRLGVHDVSDTGIDDLLRSIKPGTHGEIIGDQGFVKFISERLPVGCVGHVFPESMPSEYSVEDGHGWIVVNRFESVFVREPGLPCTVEQAVAIHGRSVITIVRKATPEAVIDHAATLIDCVMHANLLERRFLLRPEEVRLVYDRRDLTAELLSALHREVHPYGCSE